MGLLAGVVTIAVTLALVLPKQFLASASVVIDVKSPDPLNGIILPGLMSPGYMSTQVDIITSERVALRVVNQLRLNQNPQLREQWEEATDGKGEFDSWLAGLFLKNLDVKPSRESNVMQISYKAADPNFAAIVANAFVQSYVDTNVELRSEPAKQYSVLFEAQSKILREKVELAQSKLSAYQKEHGIVATDERLDIENARLNELSSQLVYIQSQAAEARSRQVQVSANSAEVLNNGVVASLKADLSRQEARLQELSARFGDAHPSVLELRANINELRSKIDAEIKRVAGSVVINSTVSSAREREVRDALDAQRNRVLKMKEQRDEISVLQRDVENAQRAYDTMQARINQSSLESQSNQTNISVLRRASPPPTPASPNIVLFTMAGVFGGTLIGMVAALASELANRKVRLAGDVTETLGLNLLGVMLSDDGRHAQSAMGKSERKLPAAGRFFLPGPKQ